MDGMEAIPVGLRPLAHDLDALAGFSNCLAADDLPDLSGTDFHICKFLGRGGMGEVYAAVQLSLNRPVAVKLLPKNVIHDADSHARFVNEAQTIARLHHPNIIQTIAAGVVRGRPYFAMELMTTSPASEHAFATVEELVRFGISLADALSYIHACGVIHRDVKPGNVFVGMDGKARLADFGLACLGSALPGEKSGTHRYMAPELLSEGLASAKSDQYAFGATMLELATSVNGLRENVDWTAIVAKATAANPAVRYATMAEVAEDLNRFLRREPVLARPAGLWRRMILGAQRNPIAAIGLCLTGFCLVALIASLVIGYVRVTKALAATEREAGQAAQTLAATITTIDRSSKDVRANEIERAISTVKALSDRFPDNEEIKAALDRLEYARRAHAKLKARRGGNLRPPAHLSPSRE